MDAEDSFIIPPTLFDLMKIKVFILIDIPSCEKNEKKKSKDFIKKFHHFTNGKYHVLIYWITKKVKSLFPFKNKNIYPDCKINDVLCSCVGNCVGESKRNMATRLGEFLYKNIQHSYNWTILANF